MTAFDGVGNGDFSQSLVRHKAVTMDKDEPIGQRAPLYEGTADY